jgi:hypothetical protein
MPQPDHPRTRTTGFGARHRRYDMVRERWIGWKQRVRSGVTSCGVRRSCIASGPAQQRSTLKSHGIRTRSHTSILAAAPRSRSRIGVLRSDASLSRATEGQCRPRSMLRPGARPIASARWLPTKITLAATLRPSPVMRSPRNKTGPARSRWRLRPPARPGNTLKLIGQQLRRAALSRISYRSAPGQ